MAITVNSVKCPECGASLPIEEGRTQVFCSFCGAKMLVTNENEHIYRHIDEAGIKQAETDQIVELKRLEIAEKKRATREKTTKLKIIISLALAALGILLLVIGENRNSMIGFLPLMGAAYVWMFPKKEEDDDDDYDGKVKVPSGISEYEKKSYIAIEAMFKGAGFTNIQCIPLNDLIFGLIKKPKMVESITINGKEITSGGKKFAPDATVVISYHSVAGR